jgi:hypothetical protein
MSKASRQTLGRLTHGRDFEKKMLDRVQNGDKLDDDDFQIALDALRKESGIPTDD